MHTFIARPGYMDQSESLSRTEQDWSQDFFLALDERRRRAQEMLAGQRAGLDTLQAKLSEQLGKLAEEVSLDLSQQTVAREELDRRAAELSAQADSLAQMSEEIGRRQDDWEKLHGETSQEQEKLAEDLSRRQQQLERKESNLAQSEGSFRNAQHEIALAKEELATEREQSSRARARLEELRRQLEDDRDKLAGEQAETEAQRRRIARELQADRATNQAEYKRQKEELEDLAAKAADHGTERDGQLAELRHKRQELDSELSRRQVETKQLQESLQRHEEELATITTLWKNAVAENERVTGESQESTAESKSKLATVSAERDALAKEITRLKAELASGEGAAGEAQKTDELRRRFEMAVEDVRELKKRNSELETKLAEKRPSGGSPAQDTGGKLDWEAQKQRMLAALEADDDDSEEAKEDRLTIEGTVRITDEVVAQKDREISELKQLLGDQSTNLGSVAIGAASVAELFDHDELIQHERARIEELRKEWEEKLRQAEIDMSVERARIARERVTLEDRLQSLQRAQEQAGEAAEGGAGPGGRSDKPVRGRWLTRLGLKDDSSQ